MAFSDGLFAWPGLGLTPVAIPGVDHIVGSGGEALRKPGRVRATSRLAGPVLGFRLMRER